MLARKDTLPPQREQKCPRPSGGTLESGAYGPRQFAQSLTTSLWSPGPRWSSFRR